MPITPDDTLVHYYNRHQDEIEQALGHAVDKTVHSQAVVPIRSIAEDLLVNHCAADEQRLKRVLDASTSGRRPHDRAVSSAIDRARNRVDEVKAAQARAAADANRLATNSSPPAGGNNSRPTSPDPSPEVAKAAADTEEEDMMSFTMEKWIDSLEAVPRIIAAALKDPLTHKSEDVRMHKPYVIGLAESGPATIVALLESALERLGEEIHARATDLARNSMPEFETRASKFFDDDGTSQRMQFGDVCLAHTTPSRRLCPDARTCARAHTHARTCNAQAQRTSATHKRKRTSESAQAQAHKRKRPSNPIFARMRAVQAAHQLVVQLGRARVTARQL